MNDVSSNRCAHCGLVSDVPDCEIKCLRAERDIKRLTIELWVVATAIWENVNREEMGHWAQGIRVSIKGGDQTPTFSVEKKPPCSTQAAEWRMRDELPCPWCVINELKRNRDAAFANKPSADLLDTRLVVNPTVWKILESEGCDMSRVILQERITDSAEQRQ